MPAIPDWSQPFTLTNPYSGTMYFNVQTSDGIYLVDGCNIEQAVRATKDDVPQADGSILHHRFLTGTEVSMSIQMWQNANRLACESDQLTFMLDHLTGALRSLLNAGDNEGRLAWDVSGGNERMLDDVRLLVYPSFIQGPPPTVTFTIDSQYPYAQDLNQTRTPVADGSTVTVMNTGSADYQPVFLVNMLNSVVDSGAVNAFTIQNLDTGAQFVYDDSLPGAQPISAGGHYGEINTFANTIYEDGNGANLKAGVDQLNSEYFVLPVGSSDIKIVGADMDILWAPAWG